MNTEAQRQQHRDRLYGRLPGQVIEAWVVVCWTAHIRPDEDEMRGRFRWALAVDVEGAEYQFHAAADADGVSAYMTRIAARKVLDARAERRGWERLVNAATTNEWVVCDEPYAATTFDQADALAREIAELGGVTPDGVELLAAGLIP